MRIMYVLRRLVKGGIFYMKSDLECSINSYNFSSNLLDFICSCVDFIYDSNLECQQRLDLSYLCYDLLRYGNRYGFISYTQYHMLEYLINESFCSCSIEGE